MTKPNVNTRVYISSVKALVSQHVGFVGPLKMENNRAVVRWQFTATASTRSPWCKPHFKWSSHELDNTGKRLQKHRHPSTNPYIRQRVIFMSAWNLMNIMTATSFRPLFLKEVTHSRLFFFHRTHVALNAAGIQGVLVISAIFAGKF